MNLGYRRVEGFSLVELLVGLTAGLVVLSGAVSLSVAILRSNTDSIKATRLNQDLNAIMAIMTNEIRRAGYSGDLTTPFSAGGSLDTTSSCVHYAYAADTDSDGSEDNQLHAGFRLSADGNGIEMANPTGIGFTCSDFGSSAWAAVSNDSETEITAFTISDALDCASDSNNCLDDDGNRVACTNASAKLRVRKLCLSLSGRLNSDNSVASTVQEVVRLRNIEPL